jgi:hypothetical protein
MDDHYERVPATFLMRGNATTAGQTSRPKMRLPKQSSSAEIAPAKRSQANHQTDKSPPPCGRTALVALFVAWFAVNLGLQWRIGTFAENEAQRETLHRAKRVSYTLHHREKHPFVDKFNPHTNCQERGFWPPPENKVKQSADLKTLSDSVYSAGVLDFTTTIATDLKIIVIGDSVGLQYSQGMEEVCEATAENRQVLRYSWGEHEGIHVSAPVSGGGVIAGIE